MPGVCWALPGGAALVFAWCLLGRLYVSVFQGHSLQALESHVGISLQAPESLSSIFLFSKDSATHRGLGARPATGTSPKHYPRQIFWDTELAKVLRIKSLLSK